MFKYVKHLEYPVNVSKKDLKMAKLIISQVGGSAGELGATLRYFMQKFTMPDEIGRALLNDIATEELAHLEIVSTIVYQLMKDATIDELKAAGLSAYYTDHGKGVYPMNSEGVPFDAKYISVTGNPLIDLSEDLAAEEKARGTYEYLIDLATDQAVIEPLLFLRQREVIHFNRFKELYDYYKNKGFQE
jgi:spore coat protein JC